MASQLDPEGVESRALLGAANFTGARVLEIGSGDGRLTFRYASRSRTVAAVELERQPMTAAVETCPRRLRQRLVFLQADALMLPLRPAAFDIAIFAWSL